MKSPWKSFLPMEPDREYVVLASHIPPRSRSSTWKLFRGASAVKKQLKSTDGCIGFSLLARPLAKDYATISVWRDQAALKAFATEQPHLHLMRELGPAMDQPKFVQWTTTGTEGRPTWAEAMQRLGRA